MSNQSFSDKLNKTAQDMRAVGEALAEQPQRYSHRNGETEPPQRRGLYWQYLPCAGSIVYVDFVVFEEEGFARPQCTVSFIGQDKDEDIYELDINTQWWGPVQAPWHD